MRSLALVIVVALHPLSAPAQGRRVEVRPHDDGSINNTLPPERRVTTAPEMWVSPTDRALGYPRGRRPESSDPQFLPPLPPVIRMMEKLDKLSAELEAAVGVERLDRRRASKRAKKIARLSRAVWREIQRPDTARERPDPTPRAVRVVESARVDAGSLSQLVDDAAVAVALFELRARRQAATRPATYDVETLGRLEELAASVRKARIEALDKLERIEALARQIRADVDGRIR